MTFVAPYMLWALLALPAATITYLLAQRKNTVRLAPYAGLRVLRSGPQPRWRRHVPFVLLAFAIAAMIFALSRPMAVLTLPASFDTVILVIDVSGSMGATDVAPTRLSAAQAAARTFIAEQPGHTRIGLVAFGDKAGIVQHPTHDRSEMRAAVDRLRLRSGTAVGSGVIAALSVLFPNEKIGSQNTRPAVAPASTTSAAIILLTDGQSSSGVGVMEAAHAAADRGIRVFTVGIGTAEGEVIAYDGWRARTHLDEDTLREVASVTGAEYFQAQTAGELKRIYSTLTAQSRVEKKEMEITSLVSALAAVLAIASAGISLLWFNRIF